MPPSFADLGVAPDAVSDLAARRIDAPFPIQAATLPDALAGRDVAGKAPTGSGKTLAFGLAIVDRCTRAQPGRPTALVLVPTRELAGQVADELKLLARPHKLRVATVYGGVGFGAQRKALRTGVDILVACPGRLADLIGQGDVRLDAVTVAVVDEADRMADMGFLPEVRRLLDQTPRDRQTLLFSATLDGAVDVLVERYQRDPARHEVAGAEDAASDATHLFWRIAEAERLERCAEVVNAAGPTIVFCRTRHRADRVAKRLGTNGVQAAAIHGGRSQVQRERALKDFATGRVAALVATDVAARGIHVDDVAAVVHFDLPPDPKDYVHRSGRTARAGAAGLVVSLVAPVQEKEAKKLQKTVGLDRGLVDPDVGALRKHLPDADRARTEKPVRAHNSERHADSSRKAAKSARRSSARGDTRIREAGPSRERQRPPEVKSQQGSIRFYDRRKGYGFVIRPGRDDLFFHASALGGIDPDELVEGRPVRYQIEQGRKGEQAAQLHLARRH
ncbi:MAG: DEAD/DEAH box helicase [Acidimicrobiia bacterium]|nr:DEAD/DEAH box helicase [Acidimicrobiia bacterium]